MMSIIERSLSKNNVPLYALKQGGLIKAIEMSMIEYSNSKFIYELTYLERIKLCKWHDFKGRRIIKTWYKKKIEEFKNLNYL